MKSCVYQSCCHGDGVPVVPRRMCGAAGCTHPQDHIPLEVHHNRGKCVYSAYLWMNDFHFHDVLNDQNGPLVASQTNQSLLAPNDRLLKPKQILSVSCFVR